MKNFGLDKHIELFRGSLVRVFLVSAASCLIAWGWAASRSETYVSEVDLQVQWPRASAKLSAELLKAVSDKLASRALEQLIAEEDLFAEKRQNSKNSEIAAELRKKISVIFDGSDVIRLGYGAEDPQFAQRVLNQVASLYETKGDRERASRLKEAEVELAKQEDRLRQFNTRFFGPQLQEQTSNLTALNRLILRLQTSVSALHTLQQERLQNPNEQAAERPQPAGEGQENRTGVASGDTPAAQAGQQQRGAAGPIDTLNKQIEQRLKEQEALRKQMAGYSAKMDFVPRIRQQQASINKDYENARQLYQGLLTEENQPGAKQGLGRGLESYRFRVVAPASLPEQSVGKGELKSASIGWIMGLLLGVGLVIARKPTRPEMLSEDELTKLTGLAVLASIPWLPKVDVRGQENTK